MPVGAAGVGAAAGRSAFAFASGSAGAGVGEASGAAEALGVGDGLRPASPSVGTGVNSIDVPRVIATNATVDESGDHRMVSGKCTAIASAVTFLRIRPSAVYMSNLNSDDRSSAL